jgi:hypothetical protein
MVPIDYTGALARTRLLLMESGTAIWADADLQGAIQLALGEISLYAGQALTLNGLDSAVSTTVPAILESALVVGSAGYAAAARAEDQAEQFELANESATSATWSSARLTDFRSMLGKVYPAEQSRTGTQKAAASGPWANWEDDFGEVEKEDI